jgi:hypothetical protein
LKPSIPLGIAALLRFFIPGAAAFIFSWPLLESIYRNVGIFSFLSPKDGSFSASDAGLIAAIAFLFGLIVSLMDDPIYKLYEGLFLWPRWLREPFRAKLNARVRSLYRFAEEVRSKDSDRYNKIWAKLRQYPLDENGVPYAKLPTRLGNILYAYESYPESRYNMDAIFYFPRLWFIIDEHNQKEFRTIETNSESPLYLSFVSGAFALLYLILAFIGILGGYIGFAAPMVIQDSGSLGKLILWGLSGISIAAISYYISLPLHIVRGEHFKALFDLYRKDLDERIPLPELQTFLKSDHPPTLRDKWAYLQYERIICPICGRGFPASLGKCPKCGPVESYEKEVSDYKAKIEREFGELS